MGTGAWRLLFFAGAGLCIAAGTACAAPPVDLSGVSGYGEFYWQEAWVKGILSVYDPLIYWGAASRTNFWIAPQSSLQVDMTGEWFHDQRADDGTLFNGTAGLHLSRRDPQHGLFGIFGGFAATNDYEQSSYYGTDLNVYGGIEGQAYFGNLTLYGQAGYIYQLSGVEGPANNSQHDNWFAQASVRYFPMPTTKIEGTVGYFEGIIWGPHQISGETAHGIELSAEIEQQLAPAPLSIFARIDDLQDPQYFEPLGELTVGGGIRVRFGDTKTLFDQDRDGATLKTYNFDTLGFYRWNS